MHANNSHLVINFGIKKEKRKKGETNVYVFLNESYRGMRLHLRVNGFVMGNYCNRFFVILFLSAKIKRMSDILCSSFP